MSWDTNRTPLDDQLEAVQGERDKLYETVRDLRHDRDEAHRLAKHHNERWLIAEAERDRAIEQRDAEEKAAIHSVGILSDVCDVVFADPQRAMTHGYDGVVERCRIMVAAFERIVAHPDNGTEANDWNVATAAAALRGETDHTKGTEDDD